MSDEAESKTDRTTRLARQIERRRAEGAPLTPVSAPQASRHLSGTFWGQAWCRHLADFEVYAHSLRSGRTLLRKGHVHDLTIHPGSLTAVVADGELWDVRILIDTLDDDHWQSLASACTGQVDSLLDLLAGRLGEATLQTLTHPTSGLFPQPGQIRCICTCIDDADPCKHASAALYAAGILLDADPTLLFTLRAVNASTLLSQTGINTAEDLAGTPGSLGTSDLAALFGIHLTPDAD